MTIPKHKRIDLTGMRFGRLVVLSKLKKRAYSSAFTQWKCRCDCGNEKVIVSASLRRGASQSCGCLRNYVQPRLIHGRSNISTYFCWKSMIRRCSKEGQNDKGYKNYGGRGIKVCKRWLKFENFLEDMGEAPKGLTLDRKNNNGNYNKHNCRWATMTQQIHNRRKRI